MIHSSLLVLPWSFNDQMYEKLDETIRSQVKNILTISGVLYLLLFKILKGMMKSIMREKSQHIACSADFSCFSVL